MDPVTLGMAKADARRKYVDKLSMSTPASPYRFLLTGTQAIETSVIDRSGNGADAIIPAATYSPSALWANKGYITTEAGTGKGVCISADKTTFDLATDSLILAFTVNAEQPTGNPPLMGNGDASGRQGIYISARSTGQVRVLITTSTGLVSALIMPTGVVFDGTDHHVVVAIDAPTRSVFVFIDGLLAGSYPNYYAGTTTPSSTWNFGSSGNVINAATTMAAKLKGLHLMVLEDAGLPSNIGQVARKLFENPSSPISQSEFLSTSKSVLIAVGPGQSNEVGSGLWRSFNTEYGYPLIDPVAPNGAASRSWWPLLSDLLGQRGVWTDVVNTAVGSTSATSSWCGHVRAWESGLAVGRGSYVLSDGGLWKCNYPAGTAGNSTVAPTGTSPTTGADSVPWVYIGIPEVHEVDGYVFKDGDSRFDPNGYFAAAEAQVAGRSVDYDEKWAIISIGQGDKTMNAPRVKYAQALINATEFWLSRGFKVALGFTCYGATTGLEAWYQSDLIPGWQDALDHFEGNPDVIPGANLRTALGVLPVQPNEGIPGLKGDQLHMNDYAYALASKAWRDALVAGGWA